MDQEPRSDTTQTSKKKWGIIAIIAGAIVLTGVAIVIISLINKPKVTEVTQKKEGPKEFVIHAGDEAVTYAGNNVYDACNLISFDTVRANITNYQTLLDSIKTDQRPTQPLVIEHNFIDRNIPDVLGKDDQARAKGTILGSAGSEGISQFVSTFDSLVWSG